jgi:glycyl-tRNA synthetase
MAQKPVRNDAMEKLVSLCKRRGFVFPTAEKYGGLQGFWDWGPLGVELKNNIKREWWKRFVQERRDVVGLDSAIITNPKVWEKSGHLSGFRDFLIECKVEKCHNRVKINESEIPSELSNALDHAMKTGSDEFDNSGSISDEAKERVEATREAIREFFNSNKKCKKCGSQKWTKPQYFNLMVAAHVGPTYDPVNIVYLRPETAQNIFVNYDTIIRTSRMKVPFGIAQIGKAFRNEITPGNFIFRSREFEQMELEYFVDPQEDEKWFRYWVEESLKWFTDHGIKNNHLRKYEQKKEELAHYAKTTTDVEYQWPFDKGWGELIGVANRTDFDLKAHGMTEGVPYVIEPSFGVERAALAFLLDAYEEVKGGRTTTTESTKEQEVVLRLHKTLAPIKIAILPLSKKEQLQKVATEILETLNTSHVCAYDDVASIGRRYRRQDEIGTPYCVTVDFESLEDKKVTIRDRDTMQQERVTIQDLPTYFHRCFSNIPS